MPLGEYNYKPPSLAEILLGHMMPMAGGQTDDRLMLDYLRRMQDEGGSDRWRELGRDADMGSMLTDDTGLMLEALKKMQDEGRDPQGRLLDSGIPSVLQSKTYDHLYDEAWVPQVVDPPMPPPDLPGQYVQEQVTPPPLPPDPPAQNSWEQFQQMNPDLDYGKVAEQAGGNVPGGNFSAMESSVTYTPTEADEALYDYVANQIPRDESARMLDKRSRAYDPNAAKMIMDQIAQDQAESTASAGLAIQEKLAEAKMKEATAYETLANQGRTAGGYQFGGGGGAPSASAQMSQAKMASEELLTMMVGEDVPNAKMINDAIMADSNRIKLLAGAGRFEEVQAIIEKYIGRNPENTPPPPGARELADKEGTTAVSPTGGKYRIDPETGELVYTG